MANNKAPINAKKTPEYFLNIPKYQSKGPVQESAMPYLSKMSNAISGALTKMQERNDKFALTAFNEKVASLEKSLNLMAREANTPEAIDDAYNKFKEDVDNTAKEMLGTRLYNNWSTAESTNYYDLINDSMERAKVPVMQKQGKVLLDNIITNAANNRATADDEGKTLIDRSVEESIKYAMYPEEGNIPVLSVQEGEAELQAYRNNADVVAVKHDSDIDAKETMHRLDIGYYKNLSAEQIAEFKPKVQKLVDKQEQSDLYEYAKGRYTDPKSGQVDYAQVVSYLNTQAEKDFKVSPDNAKAAADMALARYNRDEQLKNAAERENLANVYDQAFSIFLNGDVEQAIQMVRDSDIPGDDKYKIISELTKGANSAEGRGFGKVTNKQVYSDLAMRIVNGEIYDAMPITREFAFGNLSSTDKNNLIELIKQVQEPSSTYYKRAMKQAESATKSGLFGYKQVDTDTKAYISQQLTQEYRNAVKDGKTLQEIETMFNPVRVNALVKQYVDEYPAVRESYEKQIQAEREEAEGTARIQREYESLQYDISKGVVKTHEDLKKRIDSIESNNSYYNTVDVQFDLEKQLQDRIDYYKGGVISEAPEQKLIVTSAQVSAAVHNATIAKPVLKLGVQPSKPGESIEEYTKRLMNK